MRPITAAAVGLVVGAVVVGGAVWAANRDDADPATDRESSADPSSPIAECATLIPDSAFEALGWRGTAAAAAPDGERCRRTHGKNGYIVVGERSRGGDLSPEGVRKEYDARCESLDAGSGPATWISGSTACAEVSAEGIGLSELYLLTEQDRIVQVRITAFADTEPAEVREALGQLVEVAEATY